LNDEELAAALAVGAVTLVRRLRAADRLARLSGPQASALGVIIYAGRIRMSQLAQLEEVSRPAITKTVAQLEALKLAFRKRDPEDGRASFVSPTPKGKQLFEEGHSRRTAPLAAAIAQLDAAEREKLVTAVHLLEVLNHSIRRAADVAAPDRGAQGARKGGGS
jgi:DNA-binding MarR family transcriptional regulator